VNSGRHRKLGIGLLTLLVVTSFRVSSITHADDTLTPLQQQLKEIERQIAEDKAEIAKTQGQAKTLANKIKALGQQQALLQLQIKSTEVTLSDAENRLQDAQIALQDNEKQREILRDQLAQVIRRLHVADNKNLLLTFISSKNIFDVLDTANEYQQLTGDLSGAVVRAKETSVKLAEQESEYALEQEEAARLQALHGLQQVSLRMSVGEQKTLLTETKGQEAEYQAELGDHKAQAAAIRNRIYELLDTGNTHITFGEAVKIATWVGDQTGIEPAFLLSVLSQESNLGSNVGTCNRVGDPPSKNWKVVMKPTRDHTPFLAIMDDLDRSPEGTPISCPMRDKSGGQIGWGGAMGPAQFIPSTWVGYSSKVTKLTGQAADPWDIRDAFVASALKLMNDGAGGGDEGEWAAAMRYFSGSTNTRFRFYGDQVMTRTEQYREDIKELQS
jgi:peptidoglycan hydrolase CwlO-like protein